MVCLSRVIGLLIAGVDAVSGKDDRYPDGAVEGAGIGGFGKAAADANFEAAPPKIESWNEGVHAVGDRAQLRIGDGRLHGRICFRGRLGLHGS
jgi:hypothetical protein